MTENACGLLLGMNTVFYLISFGFNTISGIIGDIGKFLHSLLDLHGWPPIARTLRSRRSVFIPMRWLGQGGTHSAFGLMGSTSAQSPRWDDQMDFLLWGVLAFIPWCLFNDLMSKYLWNMQRNLASRPQWEKHLSSGRNKISPTPPSSTQNVIIVGWYCHTLVSSCVIYQLTQLGGCCCMHAESACHVVAVTQV